MAAVPEVCLAALNIVKTKPLKSRALAGGAVETGAVNRTILRG